MDQSAPEQAGPARSDEAAGARRPREQGEVVPTAVRRTLARAPSERYGPIHGTDEGRDAPPHGSLRGALIGAIVPAVVGWAALVVLGSPLALAEPLALVALGLGVATGLGARRGGGTALERRRRRMLAVSVALIAVFVAEIVVWRLALAQGGDLAFPDYELQAFGPVAVLQPVVAGIAAWSAA